MPVGLGEVTFDHDDHLVVTQCQVILGDNP